ncbi:MAG: ammonium transporter [Dehalococcoidia bacterium]
MEIDSGSTAWMLAASALVLFMTPGLAFFYGGLTRSKNVAATIMQSFITIGVIAILWAIVGYSLAFGPDRGLGLIGNFDHFGLKDVGAETDGTGVPHLLFMAFQMMFAIITPALITGAFAERARFGPFLMFIALWSLIVYAPVAHWVFGVDGWLNTFSGEGQPADIGINGLDFAGGLAIHVNAGAAALAAVLVFGSRKGYGSEPMEPHDVTMVVLGAAILWFGWFGFNAGSAVGANAQAVYAFVNTNVAAAAAALTWTFMSWLVGGKPSVVGAAAGAVAGLVAVTPASGYIEPMEAIITGAVSGVVCYLAVRLINRLRLDDSLDVVGVHGVGGAWGALATGLFATATVGAPEFREGLMQGEWRLLWDNSIGIVAVAAYSFVGTFVILKVLDYIVGIRVSEEEEQIGLDVSQHGERAYTFDEAGAIAVPSTILPMPPVTASSTSEGH